jgi:hypothetical protein
VTEIREVLRARLSGAGLRQVAAQGVDRKIARRYVQAAAEAGLAREAGAGRPAGLGTHRGGRPGGLDGRLLGEGDGDGGGLGV